MITDMDAIRVAIEAHRLGPDCLKPTAWEPLLDPIKDMSPGEISGLESTDWPLLWPHERTPLSEVKAISVEDHTSEPASVYHRHIYVITNLFIYELPFGYSVITQHAEACGSGPSLAKWLSKEGIPLDNIQKIVAVRHITYPDDPSQPPWWVDATQPDSLVVNIILKGD